MAQSTGQAETRNGQLKSGTRTFEQLSSDRLAILFGFGSVVGIDLARVIGLQQRNILTHFACFPFVGEGHDRLFHVSFRRR